MKNTVLTNFFKGYKEYIVDTDHTANVADSYCTYLRKGCALLNLGEGFLELFSTILDGKVRSALCEYLMSKLCEAFEEETDKAVKKQISNYKSAVSMLSEFVGEDGGSEEERGALTVSAYEFLTSKLSESVGEDDGSKEASPASAMSAFTIALPHESVYTREDLLRIFYSRLSTQDRFYSDGCFPARIITKINARRRKLYTKISLNTRFLIDKDKNKYLLLREIDLLVIQRDGYVKIESGGKTYDLYTAVYKKGKLKGYELFCVDSVNNISLDHIRPVHSELPNFLADHEVYRKFSESVQEHKSKNPGMTVVALAADYFVSEYPKLKSELDENILLDEICAFIDSLQLVALHRSYNSSKSDEE